MLIADAATSAVCDRPQTASHGRLGDLCKGNSDGCPRCLLGSATLGNVSDWQVKHSQISSACCLHVDHYLARPAAQARQRLHCPALSVNFIQCPLNAMGE